MVFKFLNHRFRDMEIKRDVYDMSGYRTERFYSKSYAPIIESKTFFKEKRVLSKINHFVKNDLRNYFNLNDTVIEMYLLEWCWDRTNRHGKTYKNEMDL